MRSLATVGAFLRFQDMKYAAAVTDMSYRLCQDAKAVDKGRSCRAEASQTYKFMDPGTGTVLAPATLGVALLWTIFGLLAAALVFVVRFVHVVAGALEGIAPDYRKVFRYESFASTGTNRSRAVIRLKCPLMT